MASSTISGAGFAAATSVPPTSVSGVSPACVRISPASGEGVFVQWMNAGFLDEELFGSIGNTLLDAFEHVRLYRPIPGMLIFLGSDAALI